MEIDTLNVRPLNMCEVEYKFLGNLGMSDADQECPKFVIRESPTAALPGYGTPTGDYIIIFMSLGHLSFRPCIICRRVD